MIVICTLFLARCNTPRRSAFRSGTRGERLRCVRPSSLGLRSRLRLSGCWFLELDRAELRPRESPGPRRGTPARTRRETPTGSTRRHPPNCRRGTPGAWPWRPRRIVPRRLRIVLPVEPVLAPFPHVAVHVVQAPGVRLLRPDRLRVAAAVALNQAYSPRSFASSPKLNSVIVPARQAYSHSASVGSRPPAHSRRPAPRPNSHRPPVARAD